jgi:hypothetical protein
MTGDAIALGGHEAQRDKTLAPAWEVNRGQLRAFSALFGF